MGVVDESRWGVLARSFGSFPRRQSRQHYLALFRQSRRLVRFHQMGQEQLVAQRCRVGFRRLRFCRHRKRLTRRFMLPRTGCRVNRHARILQGARLSSVAAPFIFSARMEKAPEIQRLPLTSADPLAERQARLRELFPEAESEGRFEFEKLRAVLGNGAATGAERYGLSWKGKSDALKAIQALTTATLLPAPGESVNWDTTGHAIIEGDNLEVLKVLQHAYSRDGGKVKLIYIDPPYNTGGDFIYPDNYTEGLASYLTFLGQMKDGIKQTTNLDTSGRYHSRWLTMMYPRLFLARNLLREDGVIFVSIDDHEVHNLRLIMDEIFGEECFAGQIAVVNNLKGRNDRKYFATAHEYLIVYARPEFETLGLPLTSKQLAEYKQADEAGLSFQWRDLRKRGGADTRIARPKLYFPVYADPKTGECAMGKSEKYCVEILPEKSDGTEGCWRWGRKKVEEAAATLKATKVENKNRWNVSYRVYLEKDGQERVSKPKTLWIGPEFSTDAGTKMLKTLIPNLSDVTPKPVELLKVIIQQSLDEDDICLDFFAGSGTTAQAVLEVNNEDGGNRRFVLVQLPEPTGREDFPTIAEITKERVRCVIKRIEGERSGELPIGDDTKPDLGFKVFKLAESNFAIWNLALAATEPGKLAEQWRLSAENVRASAGETALLYELMLKSGLPLDTPALARDVAGARVHLLDEGRMLICIARELTREQLRAMAELKPQSVLCLDVAFKGNDALKVNADLEFQSHGIKFRTA
jgi:adenine-specific DNA-methyltransferase